MINLRKWIIGCVRRQDGFSLVESAVGVFVLTAGLLSAASVLVTMASHQKLSAVFTSATHLAEQKIELLRNTKFKEIESETEEYGEITDHFSYFRSTQVTPNAGDTMKTVEVMVRHMGGQEVTFQTLIAR